jgi:hypothetical protein
VSPFDSLYWIARMGQQADAMSLAPDWTQAQLDAYCDRVNGIAIRAGIHRNNTQHRRNSAAWGLFQTVAGNLFGK